MNSYLYKSSNYDVVPASGWLSKESGVAEKKALRVGVRFEPEWAPEDLPEFARWVEQLGYDQLWFSEDLPWAGGMAMAATALAHTERLRVGLGLLPAASRNTVTLAMELSALARLAPGRLTVALGRGIPSWMSRMGVSTADSANLVTETVVALRALLSGERVTADGRHVRLRDVALGHPVAVLPEILLGTTGPVGLRSAGDHAGGVVLPEVCTPAAVRWALKTMGTTRPASVTMLAMVSVDDDRERALRRTRDKISRVVGFGAFPYLTELAGLGTDGSGPLDDAVLQSMAAIGTPGECLTAVENWSTAGADCVVLVAGDDDARESYARFATEVLPTVTCRS